MPLDAALIDEYILAITSDEQKIAVRNSTPVTIVKQHDASANTLFTEKIGKMGT